jgi:hypothetical protein
MRWILTAMVLPLALGALAAGAAPKAPEKIVKSESADLNGDGKTEKVVVVEREKKGEPQFVLLVDAPGRPRQFAIGGNTFGTLRILKTRGKQEIVVADSADCGANCSVTYMTVIGYAGPLGPEALLEQELVKGAVRVRDGGVETLESLYGPDDPMCCPSKYRFTRFEMRGDDLKKVEGRMVSGGASETRGWQ